MHRHKQFGAEEKRYYTYMVLCADNTLYTGWTTDPERRVMVHNSGTGAKYTRSRRPVRLVYTEAHNTVHDAMSREAMIKRLTRTEKLELIRQYENE